MKVSTRGRYALRLMIDLAVYSDGGAVPLKEIASRQGVSLKYMEQIISALSKAGLVASVRGANGGYGLSKPASEYTATEILEATEGKLSLTPCMDCDNYECDRAMACAARDVWQAIQDAIKKTTDSITLDALANGHAFGEHRTDVP